MPKNLKHSGIDHIIVTSLNGNKKGVINEIFIKEIKMMEAFPIRFFNLQINNSEQFLRNWLHYSAPKILYFVYFANFLIHQIGQI